MSTATPQLPPRRRSIATQRGDSGQTGLSGGIRVSKASLRVETYGTTDELKTFLGLARSLCPGTPLAATLEQIQRTLFRLGSALATPPESPKQPPIISHDDLQHLEAALAHPPEFISGPRLKATLNLARALAHRAERNVYRFLEAGASIQPTIPLYLDLLARFLARVGRP